MKLVLVMHNIRSTYNVGAILRTAEGFGVDSVVMSGWTPATKYTRGAIALPHVLEKNTAAISKTALGAESMVRSEWSLDILATLEKLRKEDYIILGLENNLEHNKVWRLDEWQKAVNEIRTARGTYDDVMNVTTEAKRGELKFGDTPKIVLVLGEEVDGIDSSLFSAIDAFLEIPMKGQKESFNVSVAAGVAMYELLVVE